MNNHKKINAQSIYHVYVLGLENGDIYVGQTSDIITRIKKHLYGGTSASCATTMHKPTKLMGLYCTGTEKTNAVRTERNLAHQIMCYLNFKKDTKTTVHGIKKQQCLIDKYEYNWLAPWSKEKQLRLNQSTFANIEKMLTFIVRCEKEHKQKIR